MSDRDDDALRLALKPWKQHWPGGNIKYPPITVLNIEGGSQLRKLILLQNILDDRAASCRFATEPTLYSPGALEALNSGAPSIFIPSGGKSAKWCWQKSESTNTTEWWWARMAQAEAANVFLVVSVDDFESYLPACKVSPFLHLVGYEGFGIGCGRAISVRLLTRFKMLGVITDDRTDSVDYLGKKIEGTLDPFLTGVAKFPICSVGPKVRFNILTVFDGTKTFKTLSKPGLCCFPSVMIASKEDLCLWLMTQKFLKIFRPQVDFESVTDCWDLLVHTDTANPEYTNNDIEYTGTKALVLERCIQSQFFLDGDGGALNAKVWRAKFGFLNLWDMIKMQESAIYQLIESLGDIEQDNVPVFLRILETHFFAPR